MIAVPALDLLNGKVTRVRQGREETAEFYSSDPLKTAKDFLQQGARILHIVDLNAALHGDVESNATVIQGLLAQFSKKATLQLGGGIRSKDRADALLAAGAGRIVLSSLAYSDLPAARQLLKKYGKKRVVLALDYDERKEVKTGGWKAQTSESLSHAFARFSRLGFSYFLLTSVKQDGMLAGPDFPTLSQIIMQSRKSAKIIASGGVSSVQDLEKLQQLRAAEAIIGKAIYEQKLPDLKTVFHQFNK